MLESQRGRGQERIIHYRAKIGSDNGHLKLFAKRTRISEV